MTLLVLVILAVIWAAVLLPPYLQSRSEGRPADSISSFQKQLSVLERRAHGPLPRAGGRPDLRAVTSSTVFSSTVSSSGGAPRGVAPRSASRAQPMHASAASASALRMSRAEAKRRRRDVLFTLAGAAAITFVMAVLLGGPVWGLNLLCDALLGGYVYLLAEAQQSGQRNAQVHYLPQRHARLDEPQLLLRRSGS
ncbi:MAG: hypothetical protein ABIV94_02380 [Acidimicrobiales bacterium]